MAYVSKKEEDSNLSFYNNNKTTIIQEARAFNESPISPRKCRALLTKIIYLVYIGESLTSQEATTLFFGTTKLFQHKDVSRTNSTDSGNAYQSQCDTECVEADGLPRDQGTGHYGRGRDHGHEQHHEGHAAKLRGYLQAEFYSCIMPNHRCKCYCLNALVANSFSTAFHGTRR